MKLPGITEATFRPHKNRYKQQITNNKKKRIDISNKSYNVSNGITAQITEHTRDTYRGGGVIPAVIPRLLTNSKYSRAPTKTAAARAAVKTHPPANTTPPTRIPMPSPNTTLFLS